MQVDETLVNQLAELACLEFNEGEKEEIKKDLERMIRFVEKLREVDTTGIEPLLQMSGQMNILREDIVEGSMVRAEALVNAPSSNGQYFLVPKVIKNPLAEQ